MKKILLLLSIITLFSCSNDDDSKNEAKEKKFVDRVILVSNGNTSTITLTYNNAGEIIGYDRSGTTLTYKYDQGRLTTITDTELNNTPYQLSYTNGELSSLKHYNDTYPVTHNTADNTYTFNLGEINFKLGIAGRDIAFLNNFDGVSSQKFTYSSQNKGPMYNMETEKAYLVPLFSEYAYIFLTSMPTTQFKINSDGTEKVYNATHTFDEDGYVTSTVLRSGNDQFLSAQFHYVTL